MAVFISIRRALAISYTRWACHWSHDSSSTLIMNMVEMAHWIAFAILKPLNPPELRLPSHYPLYTVHMSRKHMVNCWKAWSTQSVVPVLLKTKPVFHSIWQFARAYNSFRYLYLEIWQFSCWQQQRQMITLHHVHAHGVIKAHTHPNFWQISQAF